MKDKIRVVGPHFLRAFVEALSLKPRHRPANRIGPGRRGLYTYHRGIRGKYKPGNSADWQEIVRRAQGR